MPPGSIEAEFVSPPTLSPDQEEHHQLDQEGPLLSPLSCHSTHGAATYVRTGDNVINVKSLKKERRSRDTILLALRRVSMRILKSGRRAASGSFLILMSFSRQAIDGHAIKVYHTCHLIPLPHYCDWQFHCNQPIIIFMSTCMPIQIILCWNFIWCLAA